jgi:ribonuclease BN (tRNA processing enzyme)
MKFVPLGVGDAFTALHYSFCVAVEAGDGDGWVLVDCPHPIQKMLREGSQRAGVPIEPWKVRAVLLTHLHADHCSGLEGFAYFYFFYLRQRLPLYCHPEVARRLWAGHLAAGMEQLLPSVGAPFVEKRFEDFFDLHPLDEAQPVACGRLTVECRRTIHHIPTTALRISDGNRRLGISADTAFDETLIAWLGETDLVIHETNHGVHTPYARLAALDEPVRKKMRLIHYPDDFDLAASVIEPLEEGRLYTV